MEWSQAYQQGNQVVARSSQKVGSSFLQKWCQVFPVGAPGFSQGLELYPQAWSKASQQWRILKMLRTGYRVCYTRYMVWGTQYIQQVYGPKMLHCNDCGAFQDTMYMVHEVHGGLNMILTFAVKELSCNKLLLGQYYRTGCG